MSRLLRQFLLLFAVLFFVSVFYAGAKKPAGNGGGGGGAKVTTEMCKLIGDLSSASPVEVGIEVKTYGHTISLTLSPSLVSEYAGNFQGVARVLKKDGRLDFYFDHSGNNTTCGARIDDSSTNVCPDRLILLDGIYDRKADTVIFSQPAHVYLYVDSGVEVIDGREMTAQESVTVDFEPYDD